MREEKRSRRAGEEQIERRTGRIADNGREQRRENREKKRKINGERIRRERR